MENPSSADHFPRETSQVFQIYLSLPSRVSHPLRAVDWWTMVLFSAANMARCTWSRRSPMDLGIIQVKHGETLSAGMVFSHLLGCTPSIQLKKLDSQSYLTDNAKSSISSIDCFDLFCLEKDSMDFQHNCLRHHVASTKR